MIDRWQDLEILSNAVLHLLYQNALTSDGILTIEQVSESMPGSISATFIEKAMERLEYHRFVTSYHSTIEPAAYKIESLGIEAYQKRINIPESPINSIRSKGLTWLFQDNSDVQTSSSDQHQAPRFTEFRDQLIRKLYERRNENGYELVGLKELAEENNLQFREGWIFDVEDFLDTHGYALVTKTSGGEDQCSARLNADGMEYAESLIERLEPETSVDTVSQIPASDRVVRLDHNNPEYVETLKTLDQTIQEFENDHNLDNEFGREKNALLATIKAGRVLLEDVLVNVQIGFALLVLPLRRVVAKYDEAIVGGTVGAVAATALAGILKLLGLA